MILFRAGAVLPLRVGRTALLVNERTLIDGGQWDEVPDPMTLVTL